MEKIDIEKLGEHIIEVKDGKPWIIEHNGLLASRQCAEKINEIIDYLKNK